jgi:hypothetical protein
MGLSSPGASDDFGQFLTPSVVDGDLVTLPGLLLRLLAGPAEPELEDLTDVLGMVSHPEMSLDQHRDAVGGPKLGAPAVLPGPLQEEPFKLLELIGVEARGSTGMGLGGELFGGLASQLQPGVDGGPAAAEEAGDHGGMFALIDELNGTAAPAFEFFCSSDRSHTSTTELHKFLFSLLCWSQ